MAWDFNVIFGTIFLKVGEQLEFCKNVCLNALSLNICFCETVA